MHLDGAAGFSRDQDGRLPFFSVQGKSMEQHGAEVKRKDALRHGMRDAAVWTVGSSAGEKHSIG